MRLGDTNMIELLLDKSLSQFHFAVTVFILLQD